MIKEYPNAVTVHTVVRNFGKSDRKIHQKGEKAHLGGTDNEPEAVSVSHYTKTALLTEEMLIEACRRGERRAQQALYDRYSPAMFGVARRYLRRQEDAEDILVEAFYKVFANLDSYSGEGSFEGWIRRIVVNESLMHLRRNHALKQASDIDERVDVPLRSRALDNMEARDILDLLDQLPTGYRTIFNLYVLEGYKHREIAEMLDISINTSKSQLILAKKRIRQLLVQIGYPDARVRDES